MRRLPDLATWERVCKRNNAKDAKALLRAAGWVHGGPPEPRLAEGIDACWAVAMEKGAHKVVSTLPRFGFVPFRTPVFEAALAQLLKQICSRHSMLYKDPMGLVWETCRQMLSHVDVGVMKAACETGDEKGVLEWLEKDVFRGTVSDRMGVLEWLLKRGDPTAGLTAQRDQFDAFAQHAPLRLANLLGVMCDRYGQDGFHYRDGLTCPQAQTWALAFEALANVGFRHPLASEWMGHLLKRDTPLELIHAAGAFMHDLPGELAWRKRFFAQTGTTNPFEGPEDVRLSAEPWGRWLAEPNALGWLEAVGEDELKAHWKAMALAEAFPQLPSSHQRRPRF